MYDNIIIIKATSSGSAINRKSPEVSHQNDIVEAACIDIHLSSGFVGVGDSNSWNLQPCCWFTTSRRKNKNGGFYTRTASKSRTGQSIQAVFQLSKVLIPKDYKEALVSILWLRIGASGVRHHRTFRLNIFMRQAAGIRQAFFIIRAAIFFFLL